MLERIVEVYVICLICQVDLLIVHDDLFRIAWLVAERVLFVLLLYVGLFLELKEVLVEPKVLDLQMLRHVLLLRFAWLAGVGIAGPALPLAYLTFASFILLGQSLGFRKGVPRLARLLRGHHLVECYLRKDVKKALGLFPDL